VKLQGIGNRLRLGSWRILVVRGSSRTVGGNRQSRAYSSVLFPAVKQAIYDPTPPPPPSPPVPKAATSTSKLIELTQTITRETEKLDRHIKENHLPEPSFDVDAPLNFPKVSDELKKAREEVMGATKELGELVSGPTESVRWMAWDVSSPSLSSS
jgi:hypothetical protein